MLCSGLQGGSAQKLCKIKLFAALRYLMQIGACVEDQIRNRQVAGRIAVLGSDI